MAPGAELDILDILPIQLANLTRKLPPGHAARLLQGDSSSMSLDDASYDQVLLFFLLHEQPAAVRRATVAEAVRVLKPGGRMVIVDYHRPAPWHPMRPLMRLVFKRLEPYAMDLWRDGLEDLLPALPQPLRVRKTTVFGGLYQMLVIER